MVAKRKMVRWLFPTNTNNLRMILAQGLLTSPEGFSKYYKDSLSDFDGYLPLFNLQIPVEALNKATSEAGHLTPCILEFDLKGVSGQVKIREKESYTDIKLESVSADSIAEGEQLNFPLPMPLGCISKVIFRSKKDLEAFKKDVSTRSNVVLNNLKLHHTIKDSKLFEKQLKDTQSELKELLKINASDSILKPEVTECGVVSSTQVVKPNYPVIYAYGGLLSLLFYHAKNGKISHDFLTCFSKGKTSETDDSTDQFIHKFIYDFFYGDIDDSQSRNKILKGIISSCIDSKDFKNIIIDFLRTSDWNDKKAEKRSIELAGKLHDYASNSSLSTSEWFDSAKPGIEKILLMLFTREDSESFIEYQNPNITFSEHEQLLFSMFFGIRDSFIKSPSFLKKYNGLQSFVSYMMANYTHTKMNSGISFKEIKAPKTVWQFVDGKLSKPIVKSFNLESCVNTIMPKKDFQQIKGKSIYSGYYEPTYEVVGKKYYEIMSSKKITDTDYNKLK